MVILTIKCISSTWKQSHSLNIKKEKARHGQTDGRGKEGEEDRREGKKRKERVGIEKKSVLVISS